MDYSIVIPVFNKAELTRNCLAKLQQGLAGAGEGEVIVIDNASSDHTPQMLATFPWIRVIRNERNLGFAGANNQGAREACGRVLVLLNNDTESISAWLEPMMRQLDDPTVGAVGAKLLFEDRTIQHAGVLVRWWPYMAAGFGPFHHYARSPENEPGANVRREYQIVTGACLATPRDLYVELGGLDEGFWNGSEDVDYCFKVRARGLRVVYEPAATLFHYESKSGSQRFRRTQANLARLSERWRDRVLFDAPRFYVEAKRIEGLRRASNGVLKRVMSRAPAVPVLVHGAEPGFDRAGFECALRANTTKVENVVWTEPGAEVETARALIDLRGERFAAFVRADTVLEPGWLDELLARVTTPANAAAATFVEGVAPTAHVPLVTADARCTLLRLRHFPQHVTFADFPTLDESMADLLQRMLQMERGTIGVAPLARLGPAAVEPNSDPVAIEDALRAREPFARGMVSIVTLSWNAPEYTIKALESIRQQTAEPYEVIVVDNGSGPATLEMLGRIDDPHVRVIYNKTNRGFAGGNNDGIAHARGDYVILLNNDVIVTQGWADGLVDAFRRIPGLGISAPRSNYVTGDQQVADCRYRDESEMHAFAVQRRGQFEHRGYVTDRAIGFCWCINRQVLDEIGALDEGYAFGNFEDDDYCMRVRAAGYQIYVCDDVFIHHFGSRSFAANNVDYSKTLNENWAHFAKKWGMHGPLPADGYRSNAAHARGFVRSRHFLPFPPARDAQPPEEAVSSAVAVLESARAIFGVAVRSESDWTEAAKFVKRFALAFAAEDGVVLEIGCFGDPRAHTVAMRVERILEKAGVSPETCADVDISDYDEEPDWAALVHDPRYVDILALEDRSPSALRRLVNGALR